MSVVNWVEACSTSSLYEIQVDGAISLGYCWLLWWEVLSLAMKHSHLEVTQITQNVRYAQQKAGHSYLRMCAVASTHF